MKKTMLILIAMFAMAMPSNAKGLTTGKWKCSKEFIDSLKLYYDEMNGYYKFKKDGTFTIKIKGIERTSAKAEIGTTKPYNLHAKHRRIYIKIKGTYKTEDNSITTYVRPEDVYCYIEPGRDRPDPPDADTHEYVIRMKETQQRMYDQEVYWNKVQAETVKRELMHVWLWNKEPVTITKNRLSIGNKAIFERK